MHSNFSHSLFRVNLICNPCYLDLVSHLEDSDNALNGEGEYLEVLMFSKSQNQFPAGIVTFTRSSVHCISRLNVCSECGCIAQAGVGSSLRQFPSGALSGILPSISLSHPFQTMICQRLIHP